MLTFGDAKASRIQRIAGVPPTSPDFADLLNDATRMLMRRGHWWGTVRRMRGCVYDNMIVWPRQAGTLLALNNCHGAIPPRNFWYDFDPVLPTDVTAHATCGGRVWGNASAVDSGTSPVFYPIVPSLPRFVRFMPTQNTDAGKTVIIFGRDDNFQPLRSRRADGTMQDGVVLPLAVPYVQSTMKVSELTRVLKDPTDGPLYGYQVDDDGNLYNLAAYASNETNPDYRVSRLQGAGRPGIVQALVKLAFVPVVDDVDPLLIENLDALALAIQAVKSSDSYEAAGASMFMAQAVREMNHELRDRLPLDQIAVNFKPFGTAALQRLNVGMK